MISIYRSFSHGIKTQGFSEYFKNLSKGMEIYRKSLPQLPPKFVETWEKQTPANLPPTYTTGFHGTGLSRVQDQIKKGVVENRGIPFYIAYSPSIAEGYALTGVNHSKDKCIVLRIDYNRKYEGYNSLFKTNFIISGEGERTAYITGILEKNPKYIEETADRKSVV